MTIGAVGEEDYLWLSGIQNYAFCHRQWALMRIENIWSDNLLTADGSAQHKRAHDKTIKESRGGIYSVRGLRIVSHRLRVSGECDVVEFKKDDNGITLAHKSGTWLPYPIEYKHGKPKQGDEDRLQLCAEAICLEEMLCCDIPFGYLFYQEIKRREKVLFTEDLRRQVKTVVEDMWHLHLANHTPLVKPTEKCRNCSIKELCVGRLSVLPKASEYIRKYLEDNQ